MAFMYPFIADKKKWPHKPDVMYWDEWPIRHASLLFGGLALDKPRVRRRCGRSCRPSRRWTR